MAGSEPGDPRRSGVGAFHSHRRKRYRFPAERAHAFRVVAFVERVGSERVFYWSISIVIGSFLGEESCRIYVASRDTRSKLRATAERGEGSDEHPVNKGQERTDTHTLTGMDRYIETVKMLADRNPFDTVSPKKGIPEAPVHFHSMWMMERLANEKPSVIKSC